LEQKIKLKCNLYPCIACIQETRFQLLFVYSAVLYFFKKSNVSALSSSFGNTFPPLSLPPTTPTAPAGLAAAAGAAAGAGAAALLAAIYKKSNNQNKRYYEQQDFTQPKPPPNRRLTQHGVNGASFQ
jgi:hypothetical protein